MKINIVGNILGIDGYSNHCRQLSNALYQLNPDIRLDTPLPPDWARHVNDAELVMVTKEDRSSDVTIAITTPPFWRIAIGDKCGKFVGFCVWEGDKIPEYWLEYLIDERVDQIWVPSHHTKDAIEKTWDVFAHGELKGKSIILTDFIHKIKVVPHGVDLSVFNSQESQSVKSSEDGIRGQSTEQSLSPRPFTFLCNKGWRGGWEDRGGVPYVLKAYSEEFNEKDNVKLLLKLNPSYINMKDVIPKLNELKIPKTKPQVEVNCSAMPYKDLANLYNQADVFVCATRAESFDLGSAEAMACGLPVIVTGYSGITEHVIENENGLFIKIKEMKKVEGDIQYEEVQWCIPDVEDLKKKMRWCFNDQEKCKEMGKNASKYIANNFTWRLSATKALKYLNNII